MNQSSELKKIIFLIGLRPYFGVHCEQTNCTIESSSCGTLVDNLCKTRISVRHSCPKYCSKYQEYSSICRCGIDACVNSGVFDSVQCECNCPKGMISG
jgi:hypothetical protein